MLSDSVINYRKYASGYQISEKYSPKVNSFEDSKTEKNSLNKEKILKKIKKLESFIEEKLEIMSQEQNDANKLIGLISKSHIVEICQLRDPPNPVKAVLL